MQILRLNMLSETAITETDLDRLSRRESRAHDCLNTAVNSWVNFVDELNAIHKEADWKAKAPTWKAYLELEFLPKLNYGYERIYQLQAAQPFASAIERTTGVLLNERQTRLVKSLGYDSPTPMAAEVMVRAQATAEYLDQPLKPKHIVAAHNVLSEGSYLGKTDLEGESIPLNKVLDITQVAIIQEAVEANKREKQRIVDNSKRVRKVATIETILAGDVVVPNGTEVIWYEDIVAETEAA
jgi:hypothetical protein